MAMPISKERLEKKRKQRDRMTLIIFSVVIAYFGLHIMTVMNLNRRAGIVDAFKAGFNHAFSAPFEYRVSSSGLLLIGVIIGIMWALQIFKENEREIKKHDNPDTVNGDAHFMTLEELEAYQNFYAAPAGSPRIDGHNNMILSKDIMLEIDNRRTRRNFNVLCIGGSGAGKSRFFATPNILQFNTNFVITDPSGELLRDYGKALENAGYEVSVLNISDVYSSSRYNPFHYIHSEKDVFILVNTLIRNTTPPDAHKGDPIWENGEKLLLNAIFLYLWHNAPPECQNFTHVMKMISMANVEEDATATQSQAPLAKLFSKLAEEDPENLAVQNWRDFCGAAEKTLKSFLISLTTRLQAFKLSDMKYLTSTDEFGFDEFSDKKKAIFVVIPTAESSFNFIVSLFYSQLFMCQYEYVEKRAEYGWLAKIGRYNIIKVEQASNKQESKKAKERLERFVEDAKEAKEPIYNKEKDYWELYTKSGQLFAWRGTKEEAEALRKALSRIKIERCGSRCPYHIRFILDEFANIGQIPDFDQKLATIRKYEMSCSIILQAISQLKELYEKKWNTIAGNCDTKLFLGNDDAETLEWLSKMLGKRTTIVENQSYAANGGGSTSYNRSSIELASVSDLSLLPDDECIVKIRGMRPHWGKKFNLEQHKNYARAMASKGQFFIPVSEEAEMYRKAHEGPLRLRRKLDLSDSVGTPTQQAPPEKIKTPPAKSNATPQPVSKFDPETGEIFESGANNDPNVLQTSAGSQPQVQETESSAVGPPAMTGASFDAALVDEDMLAEAFGFAPENNVESAEQQPQPVTENKDDGNELIDVPSFDGQNIVYGITE